jgi:hypothetical protein
VRVLDLFAGLGSGTAAFVERGHDVVTTDIHEPFKCTVTGDILNPEVVQRILELGPYDFVWASPPCQSFSVMNIGKNWTPPPENAPKTDKARHGVALVQAALDIITAVSPLSFIIENPRAKLRKLPVVAGLERRTVTLCQYGSDYMKPTDLWGGFPPTLELKPTCKNGDPCHTRAPRGSTTGTQGTLKSMQTYTDKTVEIAAYRRIPYSLSLDICEAVERQLSGEDNQPFVGRLF